MNKKRGEIILIAGIAFAVIILLSFYFDKQILEAITSIDNDLLTDILLGITFVSSEIIIFFILPILFLWQEHKRKWVLPMIVSLLFSLALGFLLKFGVQRLRPFQQGLVDLIPTLASPSFTSWNFSFPSLQVMMVFAAIPIIFKEFRKIGYVWVVFAVLVGLSRVYFGLHFMSDVLVGAVLGYAIGWVIVDLENRKRFWSRIYEKIFYGEK